MLQVVAFTVVAIVLYLVADKFLDMIEVRRGQRLEHRSLIFFAILVSLAMVSFNILERVLGGA
jgi:hypothetical protein